MAVGSFDSPEEAGNLVRAASSNQGAWPTLSYWHGDGDIISTAGNADSIIDQWTNVHGTDDVPDAQDTVDGYPHYVYNDATGRPVVELYRVTGMGHSVPVDADKGCGDDRDGLGDWVTDRDICSSYYIAKFWGLTGDADVVAGAAAQ
jgi:poly(3-hydroxybutyrate) depolymerase